MTTDWTPSEPWNFTETNFEGLTPESWCCVDCGINTAPGCLSRIELERAAVALGLLWKLDLAEITQTYNNRSEVYAVRDAVWKKTGLAPYGGCLCVGCLERRIGRRLKPKDFPHDHPFNSILPGTPRLLQRQGRW